MNYLPDACNHGAEIYCETWVSHVEKLPDGWRVHLRLPDEKNDSFVDARIVVVAAGTLGSNEIMLRSRDRGLSLSSRLGEGFSGNGDILGFGYNCDVEINGIGFGDHDPATMAPVGPCITSIIDTRKKGTNWKDRMIIEEGSIPGAVGKFITPLMAAASAALGKNPELKHSKKPKLTDALQDALQKESRKAESMLRGPYHGAINRLQTYLIMSHDDARGKLSLVDDRLRIDWPDVGKQQNFTIGNDRLLEATSALGGEYVENPIWTKLFHKSLVSVHPLGGCNMGDSAEQGVVDHKGRVFDAESGVSTHTGLYISDGSVVPTSLAVNPLLTISAVTERCCRLLADDYGLTINYD